MTKYIIFLRGINVGGNKMIKMENLRKAFEEMGFENVKTILATGNVIFETPQSDEQKILSTIEQHLEKTFGWHIDVMIRTEKEIQDLINSDPFKNITVTPQTRLYITFISEKPKSSLKIPYESSEKDFQILRVTDGEVCSTLTLSEKRNTTDSMKILEKEYGKKVTTRNWNTVKKIVAGFSK